MRLHITDIISDTIDFKQSLQDDYELDKVDIYLIEDTEVINYGYRIEHQNKVFTAHSSFKRINNTECEKPEKLIWYLHHEGQVSEHHTIGQFMDKIFEYLTPPSADKE